jgi:RecA-family ATPase
MINAIDCSKWVDSPPEKEFIVQDWLSLGEVSFLKGEREVGKSLLAQQLMTSVATGKPLLNMDVKQVKAYGVFCRTLYILNYTITSVSEINGIRPERREIS